MPYDASRDPEKARDPLSHKQTADLLAEGWHDNDLDFTIEAMAKYLSGPQDKFADAELVRVIRERAESIIERVEEAAAVDPHNGGGL